MRTATPELDPAAYRAELESWAAKHNAEVAAQHNAEVAAQNERLWALCPSPSGTIFALTSLGRIFERVRDTRDFSSGPHHVEKWLWREIAGPLTEAPS